MHSQMTIQIDYSFKVETCHPSQRLEQLSTITRESKNIDVRALHAERQQTLLAAFRLGTATVG